MDERRVLPDERILIGELDTILNQEYKIWKMRKIEVYDCKIKEPLIKKCKDTFYFSKEAKECFSSLYDDEFFELYDEASKTFISKMGKIDLYFDYGDISTSNTMRIHLSVDGRMIYSKFPDDLNMYRSTVKLSEFNSGKLTKAVR